MGILTRHGPVKLVCSVIYRDAGALKKAEEGLLRLFGCLEPAEKILAFDYTDYYHGEMGGPLLRKVMCFKDLVPVGKAYRTKLATNLLEERLADVGCRTANIDPGYVTAAKLVLLTTKDYIHRVYVGGGIFADPTLFFKDGAFCSWPWTYPDYSSAAMREYFGTVRSLYLKNLKDMESKGREMAG
jgi:hypothetical protein